MPGKMIRLCEMKAPVFEKMYLSPKELEVSQPRDSQKDVDEAVRSIHEAYKRNEWAPACAQIRI
jgi:hypothetical protein